MGRRLVDFMIPLSVLSRFCCIMYNLMRNKFLLLSARSYCTLGYMYRCCVSVIVIPTVVISVICMFVFLIPNGSTEKIAYSMSMMLTLYVNLLTVANRIPNNSNKYPYIGVYYLVCIFLIATSLLQVRKGAGSKLRAIKIKI